MATLTTHAVPHAGLVLASGDFVQAGSGGDKSAVGDGVVLIVKNGDSSAHTVTMATPGTVDSLAVADRAVAVAAGDTGYIPVLDEYRDPSDGLAHFTYDATPSTLTVAVIRVAV
jgi:hypothetical protein